MKVRERLMRKVMAVVIAAATIFSISGGTKVVPVKAAVEVAEVLDLNENLRGQYGEHCQRHLLRLKMEIQYGC